MRFVVPAMLVGAGVALATLGFALPENVPLPPLPPVVASTFQCAEKVVDVVPTYDGGMKCLAVMFVDGSVLMLCPPQPKPKA